MAYLNRISCELHGLGSLSQSSAKEGLRWLKNASGCPMEIHSLPVPDRALQRGACLLPRRTRESRQACRVTLSALQYQSSGYHGYVHNVHDVHSASQELAPSGRLKFWNIAQNHGALKGDAPQSFAILAYHQSIFFAEHAR